MKHQSEARLKKNPISKWKGDSDDHDGLRDGRTTHTTLEVSAQRTDPGVLDYLGAGLPHGMVGGRACAVVDLEGIAPPSGSCGAVGNRGSGDRGRGQDGGACDDWLSVVIEAPEMFLLAPLETSPLGTQNGSYSSS